MRRAGLCIEMKLTMLGLGKMTMMMFVIFLCGLSTIMLQYMSVRSIVVSSSWSMLVPTEVSPWTC